MRHYDNNQFDTYFVVQLKIKV